MIMISYLSTPYKYVFLLVVGGSDIKRPPTSIVLQKQHRYFLKNMI